MESINVLALHGFLGLPSDWNEIQNLVVQKISQNKIDKKINWISFDLNSFFKENKFANFSDLTEQLVTEIKNSYSKIDLICGYSLGGRVGLHLIEHDPHFFHHLMMFSAQTGFKGTPEEKNQRLKSDRKWVERFSTETFEKVVQNWNEQSVFSASAEPLRFEENYTPTVYKTALETLSQSQQKDLMPWISNHPEKITWLYGERDVKYKNLSDSLKSVDVQVIEVSDAGHRVIFDQPDFVAEEIKKKATR